LYTGRKLVTHSSQQYLQGLVVLPRWCGVLLIAYFPLFAFLLGSYGWGGIALGLLWLALGYALLSSSGAAAERPSRVS
jgi:hypothetical protein